MDDMLNKRLDEYRIVDVLGKGGMGIVYKAFDENLKKYVALKMMNPMLARDDKFMRRFDKEAQSQAQLDHPNIVRVFTFRKASGYGFIVMELIDGRTLANIMMLKQPMQIDEAVPIFKQCLEAMAHAHKLNVVHRDIKPGNIMLTDDKRVKITDFGLAKIQQSAHTTVSETTAGTLRYMSPEQVRGERTLDHRSDIYSLGITFYEILAGDLPFGRGTNDYQIYKEILETELPTPHQFNDSVPETLSQIIQKATRKEPGDRYQSARAMLDDILAFELLQRADPADTVLLGRSNSASSSRVSAPATGVNSTGSSSTGMYVGAAAAILALVAGGLWFAGVFGSAAIPSTTTLISYPPGAEVYFDGNFVGETPLTDYPANALVGRVLVQKNGYETLDTLISNAADLPSHLELHLRPLPETKEPVSVATVALGNVDIISNPAGADVYMNGRRIGRTPSFTSDLPAGRLQLELRKDGYRNRLIQVVVEKGQTRSVDVRLEKEVADARTAVKRLPDKQPTADLRLQQEADAAKSLSLTTRKSAVQANASTLPAFSRASQAETSGDELYEKRDYAGAKEQFRSASQLYQDAIDAAVREQKKQENQTRQASAGEGLAQQAQDNLKQAMQGLDGSYAFISAYSDAAVLQREGEDALRAGEFDKAVERFKRSEEKLKAAISVRKEQENAINRTINSYRLALEEKNIDGLRIVHPSLDRKAEQNWNDFFSFAKNLKVSMRNQGASFTRDGARANVQVKFEYDGVKDGGAWNNWEMLFSESNSRWIVSTINRN